MDFSKIKKILTILIINTIIFFLIYHSLCSVIKKSWDFEIPFLKQKEIIDSEIDVSMYNVESLPYNYIQLEYNNESLAQFCGEERVKFEESNNSNNGTILVFGCSYAYGHGLKKEESFSSLLSKYTNRTVYNFSYCGADAWRSYSKMKSYLNENQNELKNINNAEYVVYVYMHDHIKRYLHPFVMMNHYDEMFSPSKAEKFLNKSCLIKFINVKLKQKKVLNEFPESAKSCEFLKRTILKWHSEVKKYAPDSKFIIILWDEKIALQDNASIKYVSDIMASKLWHDLEEETNGNIKVIHTKDLTNIIYDKKYRLKADIDDWHPNAKAWELLVPSFAANFIE